MTLQIDLAYIGCPDFFTGVGYPQYKNEYHLYAVSLDDYTPEELATEILGDMNDEFPGVETEAIRQLVQESGIAETISNEWKSRSPEEDEDEDPFAYEESLMAYIVISKN